MGFYGIPSVVIDHCLIANRNIANLQGSVHHLQTAGFFIAVLTETKGTRAEVNYKSSIDHLQPAVVHS